MAQENFKKHLERLKDLAEGRVPLPKLKHNFIKDGVKVSKVRDTGDFAWELSEIGRDLEKNAKRGKEGAVSRLEVYKQVVGSGEKNEKSKKN